MAKKNAEKEPKPVKEKKTKEKKPKAKKAAAEKPSKKKKGKGKAEETSPETAAAAAETTAAEGQEEKLEKPRRSILQPVICALIGLLAVFEVFMIFVWLTNPTSEELQAQREAAAAPSQAWSLSAYSNRHGYYQPPEASSPVSVFATNSDVPATAQPRVQEQTPAGSEEPADA